MVISNNIKKDISNILKSLIKRCIPTVKLLKLFERRVLFTVCCGVVLLLVIFSPQSFNKIMKEDWAVVKKGTFLVDLIESGEVEAVSQRVITTPMMWSDKLQIVDLVLEGTLVKKGDLLIQFDVSSLQIKKEQEEESLTLQLADIEKTHIQQSLKMSDLENRLLLTQYSYEHAKLQLEIQKYESEVKKEGSRIQLKKAELELKEVRKQLEAQKIIHESQIIKIETSIQQQKERIQSIQDRIDRLGLTAPTDGMVVYQEVGRSGSRERLRNGYTAQSGEALLSIPDLSRMQINLSVNEMDQAKILTGQAVEITLDAYPDAKFQGQVKHVANLAQNINPDSKLKEFEVKIEVENEDQRLKPGMTVKARIILKKLENVLFVPIGTVYEIKSQPVVFEHGKKLSKNVTLGKRNDAYIVIEQGLKSGMKVRWRAPVEDAAILGWGEEREKGGSREQKRIE
jgi:RND family efflux transporter MFP subunit